MDSLRKYGAPPYSVALLHGGPGAPGHMAPVARELSKDRGVLEPLQTANSLDGQVEELRDVLQENGDIPVTLVGSPWGAMLGFVFAARNPGLVKKLVMVGSGVYEERFAAGIQPTRLARLTDDERTIIESLSVSLNDETISDKSDLLAQFGKIFTKADAYDPITLETETIEVDYEIYQGVWADAVKLRKSGGFLELGKLIERPVVAIHGDYDPHPAEGIGKPLSQVLSDFRFITLKNCGHVPWIERQARDEFYDVLKQELGMQ